MKLLRYGPPGQEKPGLLDADGRLRDLSAVVPDIGPAQLGDAALARLRRLKTDKLPLVRGTPRIGCPVAGIGKFIAIGLNYADHAAESGLPVPKEPVVFTKAISCIQGPDDDVMLPRGSKKSDWEVELGVIIGRTARHVAQKDALAHVAGYCVVNDVSERAFQIERGGTWDKGKGCDTFGPIGPWLVTRDEVPNPQRLGLWLDLHGQRGVAAAEALRADAGLVDLLEQLQDGLCRLRIQRRCRLIAQQYLGLGSQGSGDGHPLLLSTREFGWIGMGAITEANQLQQG